MGVNYIRVASDLHIESQFGRDITKIETYFLPKDERDSESILVLAGDISSSPQQLFEFISLVEKRFSSVIYVPGNHESYHQDIDKWASDVDVLFANLEKTHWSTLGVESKETGGVFFIFGTLWGDGGGSPLSILQIQHGMMDFRLISKNDSRFTVSDMMELNKKHALAIENLLIETIHERVVVVTHHLPSYSLCHPRFGNSLSGGFASACDSLIANGKPNLWIHGHTHDTGDSDLYGTRIVCNPFGYNFENCKPQHNNRYENKFISISSL